MSNTQPLEQARMYEREQGGRGDSAQRPLFHLTPWIGWMNDPNGFCYYEGQYHLFYQYYPYDCQWGPMHWGHAVSSDLIRWSYLPCALAPDTPADQGGCFSGSALPLPDGRLMLAYTGVQDVPGQPPLQAQCVAFGDGVSFSKSSLNPVIGGAQLPEGFSVHDFRDPKIWQEEDGTFLLAAAAKQEDCLGTIVLFESPDGLSWRFHSILDSSRGALGRMWECPDLFSLGDRQVLLVSAQQMQGDGVFHPGFGAMALLGAWDRARGGFQRQLAQPLDQGFDFYAPQTVLAPDGRRILIAWMDNWEYCKRTPREHPWYGQMCVPRELSLYQGRLVQRPVREIERLWQNTVSFEDLSVEGPVSLPGVQGRMLDMTLTVCPQRENAVFSLHLAQDARHQTAVEYDFGREELTLDRSRGGSRQDLPHMRRVHVPWREGGLTLRVLLDRESVEVFVNEGEQVLTSLLHTPLSAEGISFAAQPSCRLSLQAHSLG